MARKRTTSRKEIEGLLDQGFTRVEVAKILGITRSGVNWYLLNTGDKPLEYTVERVKRMLPWSISGETVQAIPYRQVLLHLEYSETHGKGMSKEKLRKLKAFYERLTRFSTVVRYDPDIPPLPGNRFGSFEYVPRVESDGDLIIRVDNNTKIPADNRMRWSLPAREDWPE
jgi:predicted transcriptional regulator